MRLAGPWRTRPPSDRRGERRRLDFEHGHASGRRLATFAGMETRMVQQAAERPGDQGSGRSRQAGYVVAHAL
jgi:hypothetical protein